MLHSSIHLLLHALLPAGIALLFFRKRWKSAWLIMVLTMVVDADHLLAAPIYDPNRCSIGFHPLHSMPAILAYALLFVFPKLRILSAGLLIHMGIDLLDCAYLAGF